MWHETIKKLAPDNLAVVGVVQEQHAERTRLYKQWKQYDFPIAQDSVTKLGLAVVPVFVGIDEHGIVQSTQLRPQRLQKFLETQFDPPENPASTIDAAVDHSKRPEESDSAERWCLYGDQEMLFRTSDSKSYDNAIAAYESALEKDPDNGVILFRLGCAYRQKYDELSQDDADFDQASKFWTKALASNPRQYIWRRRIEQYGPRLQKPYPFYDWVAAATKEIQQRGDEPVKLTVELTQSELAGRSRPNYEHGDAKPQATGDLERDNGEYVTIESTMVPGIAFPGKPATVHLRLVPATVKWNNESTPLTVWIESDTAKLSSQLLTFENPNSADSKERRSLEFDLLVESSESCSIKGFALYNVCGENGLCMYRRQDFEIKVPLGTQASK